MYEVMTTVYKIKEKKSKKGNEERGKRFDITLYTN